MVTLKGLASVIEQYDDLSDEGKEAFHALAKGNKLPPTHDVAENDSITDVLSAIEGLGIVEEDELRAADQKLDAAKTSEEDGTADDEDDEDGDSE